jgi:splicing factor 3B subunit 3
VVFGEIRSLTTLRLTGQTTDYVVVGSDSGKLVILSFDAAHERFERVHEETFGKSGCRRVVPGQYVAKDAKGRAIMVAALERQKFVYVLNRDAAAKLTISSPLEAHKATTVVWACVGLDTGYENPVFACLEVDYDEQQALADGVGEKMLTFYELDLGLNHVVRKWSDRVDNSANRLVAVPGDKDGPGGVLVCAEDAVYFKNEKHETLTAQLPRRAGDSTARTLLIVASATHKQKNLFFTLLQSELGDLYKVTLQYQGDTVQRIDVHYFDTVPPASDIAVLKSGFLFVALHDGGHHLYQFQGLGDDVDDSFYTRGHGGARLFEPREPKNLMLIHRSDSLSPLVQCKALQLPAAARDGGGGGAQLYALTGQGPRSALRVLRHGLAVEEVAVAPLEANPTAVWTVKRAARDPFDAYLVVSFVNATLVLSIGGETVEEVADSGLLGTAPTILAASIGDDSLLQAHAGGLRVVQAGGRVQEWLAPGRKALQHAACNGQQCVVALSGGDLYYFELDAVGALSEIQHIELGKEIACIDLAPLDAGGARGRFLSVGDFDNTVQIYSLAPDSLFSPVSMQVLPAQPRSIAMVEMQSGVGAQSELHLNVGLHNGVLLRTAVDGITGALSDTCTRFVGTKAVTLHRVRVQGRQAVLALSTRAWLCYNWHSHYHMTPLSYQQLESAASFASEQSPEGVVAVSENTVRIIAFERLGEMFNEIEYPLRYTGRKFAHVPNSTHVVVIEADHRAESYTARAAAAAAGTGDAASHKDKKTRAAAGATTAATPFDAQATAERERAFGRPRADAGVWASCVRVLDALTGETKHLLELTDNECAVSVCVCPFASRNNQELVIVGTARNLQLTPRHAESAFIHVYQLSPHGQLELLHKTPVDGIPGAFAAFDGQLLAGIGNALRSYKLGKKQLLRQCENKHFPSHIAFLDVSGTRIVVGDLAGSFQFVSYKRLEGQFHIFADDPAARWLTASCRVDYDTVAGGDKFGNFVVERLPPKVADTIEDDPTGGRHLWEQGYLNAAPHKMETIVQYHVGELITSIEKTSLVAGGTEVLLYTTIGGAIGAFIPFISKGDVDFFQHLEMHMRTVAPPLCGRDHLAYRSAYFPVKNCIDGDLCEQFLSLPQAKQKQIADELDRSISEVVAKIENQRAARLL